eukprot:gnl/MRDRNA2_/MRDRNA2_83940_c0_seq8.p1 gnl/MRDRNA2_/MRDRNA2_83940_c0~~gnl/MRDRNA2_/MRDRNA2_83940_c0_seq8.p1  ORF type:complete len:633 (-),score=161.14 gnl/MRDRNA2_/MRDRNA2_83940_c0_seq8:129-2027(-)
MAEGVGTGSSGRPGSSLSDGDVSAGMGEENMMSFIRHHMESMLKPFGENVEELHKTVVSLQHAVAALQEKSMTDTSILQAHHTRMDEMQGRQDKLMERAEATRTMLEGTIEENRRNEKPRSMRIDKLEEEYSSLQSVVEALQTTAKETGTKVERLQDVSKMTRSNLDQLQNEISKVEQNLGNTDEAHAGTVELVKRHKLEHNDVAKQFKELEQEQRYLRAKFISLEDKCMDKVEVLKQRHSETVNELKTTRKEFEQAHETTNKLLTASKDAHDVVRKESQVSLNKLNVEIAKQNAQIDENDRNVHRLFNLQDQKHAADMQNVRREISDLSDLTGKLPAQVAALESAMGVQIPGQEPVGPSRIDLLEEEGELAYKRTLRLERVLQLDPMTKENADANPRVSLQHGVLLTEDQMNQFQDQFNLYDLDRSGAVSSKEVGDILQGLGFEVDKSVIEIVMNEIDRDKSGEISFDEFCALMTKMLGPDGNLDVDGYMKSLSEAAVREARRNEIVELFPGVQDEVKKHQELIDVEKVKLTTATDQLQKLEKDHTKLLEEVTKLRKLQDLNDGYWKGMTRGFKDAKKTVYTEGDGQMVPSATRLRNALPPLGSLSSPLSGSPPSARRNSKGTVQGEFSSV